MQYGLYEIAKNIKNLVITKTFHRQARLIRYPCFIRNSKYISFNEGFTCGYNCRFESIQKQNDFGTIRFGGNCRLGDNVHIASAKKVEIGDNVLIASKVFITDCGHGRYECDTTTANPSLDIPANREIIAKETRVGNNVWIGENVVILAGITIGDGCVIGASSVVAKCIPSNCIAVGNPARIIKSYNVVTSVWEVYHEEKNRNIRN